MGAWCSGLLGGHIPPIPAPSPGLEVIKVSKTGVQWVLPLARPGLSQSGMTGLQLNMALRLSGLPGRWSNPSAPPLVLPSTQDDGEQRSSVPESQGWPSAHQP